MTRQKQSRNGRGHSDHDSKSRARLARREPIAIIGIGCRYPGAASPEQLWQNLLAGKESVGPYPGGRFPDLDALYEQVRRKPGRLVTDRGGFLKDVAGFDSPFFDISPREAVYIDPQHRLLLEVAWEALEDAGQVRENYAGSATGVYAGLTMNEYHRRLSESATEADFYSVTGCVHTAAPARLSCAFGLQGPSVAVDTACSSSLMAVHLACEALWTEEIDMALAGGANLILASEISERFTQAKMLAPDGRCKFGDSSADGFVRGEGAGIVVLKRLSQALAGRDPIYAVIRGSAANNDGRSSFYVSPSLDVQQRMLTDAWETAGIEPGKLNYIEVHGTGTRIGDRVEIKAVSRALAESGASGPCWLGSVKTNIGHAESAAGVAGLIKAALIARHRIIPISLNVTTLTPKIAWENVPVRIATQPVDLSSASAPVLVGVSSFGLTGTNVHVVLEEAQPAAVKVSDSTGPYLLPISAKTPDALEAMLKRHLQSLRHAGREYAIGDICYTAGARRTHHQHRVAIVGEDTDEFERNMAAAIAGESNAGVIAGAAQRGRGNVVFVTPGQGSQWPGMAGELFDHEPIFRQAFEQCDAAIAEESGWRLAARILGPEAEQYLTEIDVIQPALFAMSVALAALWRSRGIEPGAIVGHSMGEVAAAHLAGILTLKDAVAVICRRSRLMKTLRTFGGMATVELPLREVEALLTSYTDVSVGASNGPETTVISGDSQAIEALLKALEAREVYCRQIKVDVASHSAQVDPILEKLLAELSGIRPQPAKIPMLSTVTGEYAWDGTQGTVMDAPYWVKNLRDTVLFAPAIEKLASGRHDTFIELSPHPILTSSIEASARPANPLVVVVPSLRREKPARATMLAGLGALYAAGCSIAWEKLYPDGRCVSLPQYAFQRKRYWPESINPSLSDAALFCGDSGSLLGRRFESSLQPEIFFWETHLQIANYPWLNDHRLMGSAVFPGSGYIDMALSAALAIEPEKAYEVRSVSFVSAAYLPEQGGKRFQIALLPDGSGGFGFEIRSRGDDGETAWPLRASGLLRTREEAVTPAALSIVELQSRYETNRDAADHYKRMGRSGVEYGPAFRRLKDAWVGKGECLCRLLPTGNGDSAQGVMNPTVLDACFQAVVHVRPETGAFKAADTYLPVSIDKIGFHAAIPNEGDLFAQAILTEANPLSGKIRSNLRLVDASGNVLVDIIGMELMRVARENANGADEYLYSLTWTADDRNGNNRAIADRAAASVARLAKLATENWIIFADETGVAETMARSLLAAGGHCTLVRHGAAFMKTGGDAFEINPQSSDDLDRLLQEFSRLQGTPTAVAHLWSLDGSADGSDAERLMRAQNIGSNTVPPIAQAISRANWGNPPRLWLVTAGAMPVGSDAADIRIESAPIWGVGRGVAREHAELRASLVDLSFRPDDREARALAFEICANEKEDRIALRGDRKYVARLRPFAVQTAPVEVHKLAEDEDYRLEISTGGILDNIELREQACPAPASGEITLQVSEAGLNYNDVLKAMGLYPGLIPSQSIPLGNEAVGTVTAVGAGVDRFQIGDRVIALTPNMRTTGMMATSVTVPAILAVHKPTNLTDEQAATMTIVYATAYWALIDQARIRNGEWILIHAGAGGVGLAAIEIAKSAGARIIATVGSKEKENYVRSLGVDHVLNSRSLDFAAGAMEITQGRGVDVVLNSLAGEFLLKSLEVLAPYGRFVELGKRDVHGDSRVGLRVLRNNNSFHVVDVASGVEDHQPYMAEILAALMHRFESGEWKPLPVTSFTSADPSAPFRYMAQAKHIGKISIRMDRDVRVLPAANRLLFSAKASYLITGGLGGIALTIAQWMAKNGAGHIVLLSRRAVTEEAAAAIRQMEGRGAKVTVVRGDVTRESDIANAMKAVSASGVALKGILHTAAVVDDALIADVIPERFLPVLAPKIAGAWNLHTATRTEALDFFVLFSSIAAIHPQPGMGSYAAANAFLDAFAHYLRGLGRPAISVNWGGWDQIGLARGGGTERSFEGYADQGMRVLSAEEALDALRRALESKPAQMVAIPIDAEQFAAFHGLNDIPLAFADLVSQVNAKAVSPSVRAEILDQLSAADSPTERAELLQAHLQDLLGRVLKLASHRIDRDRALGNMGLDSLMGLEFVRRLSHSLEIAVPATVVFNYPTIRLLTGHLLQRMHFEDVAQPTSNEADRSKVLDTRQQSMGELSDLLSDEDALQALMGNASRNS